MKASRSFVDTNVLVYAHDRGSGERHSKARALIEDLWESRTGILSTQVLQELYINVRRRAAQPMSQRQAREILQDYMAWDVVVNDEAAILEAIQLEDRFQISFWDALIVQAANSAAADVLYSEDLNDGQVYGAVQLVNPFA